MVERKEPFLHDENTLDNLNHWFNEDVNYMERILYLDPENYNSEGESVGIDEKVARVFIKGLIALNTIGDNREKPIKVIMNSMGGCPYSGFAIYDAIRTSNAKVDIEVYGSAMSMGAIILQAGRTRSMHENSTIMVHDGHDSHKEEAIRNLKSWSEFNEKQVGKFYNILSGRTKKSYGEWEEILKEKHDAIYTAQEAKKIGLVDKIVQPSTWYKELFK